jgi:hypothetical protein
MICLILPRLAGRNHTHVNPKLDPELVKKRTEIQEFLAQNQMEIELPKFSCVFWR